MIFVTGSELYRVYFLHLGMLILVNRNNLIWHTDERNREKVDEYNEKCIAIMRGPSPTEFVNYQNGTRDGPIEYRYRGIERLSRLRHLKKQWDPSGIFTGQLLD